MSLFVDVALRAASILENNDFRFVIVALRAASILKNRLFLYLFNFLLQVAKLGYLLRFEPREYARQLSFEKCCRMHQSTSQMDVWSSSYDHLQFLNYKLSFWQYLNIRSVLELLVFKHCVECTSQRLKWTSGARVMIMQIYANICQTYANICKYV